MCKKFVLISVLFFSLITSLYSQKALKAEGFGSTENEAKAEALNNLSYFFYTEIKSTLNAESSSKTKNDSVSKKSRMDKKVLISTDYQLIGVTFDVVDNGMTGKNKLYQVTAIMNPDDCIPLYRLQAENIKNVIDSKLIELAKAKNDKKNQLYVELAADYGKYSQYEMILTALKADNIPVPSKNPSQFDAEYAQFSRSVTSLDKAAELLISQLPKNISGIYVNEPQFESESAVTPFARSMTRSIQNKLGSKVALDKYRSSYYLQGTYYMVPGSVDADDMVISCYLCRNDGSVEAATPMVKIPYEVYSQYKYMPSSYNLAKEIENGNVADPEFGVSIRVNGDRRPGSFKEGDSLVIETRATETCYVYVIGHVYNDDGEEFSYLFPVNIEGEGKEMFVKRIPAKDVNKWVVLNPVIDGEVASAEVIYPFGEETLQVFATTEKDFDTVVSLLPDYKESDNYWIIKGSPVEVSTKTRGLAIKKAADKASKQVHKAESYVTYSTHK